MDWEPASFQAALAAADGDPESVHVDPQLTSQFFPLDSFFYAPFATSAGTGAQHLDTVLSERLAPQRLTAGQHDDILALAQALIAEESLRYFTCRLEDLNLPAVTENHIERLREAAYKVARHRPLGEIYNLVWRSTRAAAESAQKNPRAPRVNISTHAVNQFETHALRAVTEPTWPIKAFGKVTGCGLSAMTRTLFYTVLDLQPLDTSFCDIEQGLPQPAPESVPSIAETGVQPEAGAADSDDELAFFIRWLHTYPGSWDPEAVFRCLDDLEQTAAGMAYDVEQRVARRAVTHLKLLHERLAVVLDPRQAALAVMAATDFLQHPVTGSDPQTMRTIGAVVRQRLAETVPDDAGGLG